MPRKNGGAGTMDDIEKNILRRRKTDLTESLTLTFDLLDELRSNSLLTADQLKTIDKTKSDFEKIERLVDSVLVTAGVEGFEKFCAVISQQSPQLVEELKTEQGLERGTVQPRDEMILEASALVNRKFGKTRRFSEQDRSEMALTVAAKLQLAHDEWARETNKARTELDEQLQSLSIMSDKSKQIIAALSTFLRRNSRQISGHATDPSRVHKLSENVENLRKQSQGMKDNNDRYEAILNNLSDFFIECKELLNSRDEIYDEKIRSLRQLKINNDKVKLDEIVSKLTGLSITSANMDVERKDDIIVRLESQLAELSSERASTEREIAESKVNLAARERELASLRRTVHID